MSIYNVVSASGGDDTAMLNTAFANATTTSVFLSAGLYQVSSTVTIPDDAMVVGDERIVYMYYDGNIVYAGKTMLVAVNGSSWAAGTAVLTIGNRCQVRGISVRGFHSRGDWPADGISLLNASYTRLEDVTVLQARNGIVLGATQGGSIGNELHRCCVTSCAAGIVDNTASGGFLSDGKFIHCSVNGCAGSGISFGAASWTILGCRIEQCSGAGLTMEPGANSCMINDNFFDQNGGGSILFSGNNSYNLVTGNRLKATGGNAEVYFAGGENVDNMIVSNICFPSGSLMSMFGVAPTARFAGRFDSFCS
jgi:hypothetical protein